MEKLDKLEKKVSEDKGNATETEKIMMVKHETSDFPRVFVWKIINFSEILRQAKTREIQKIDSAPFYTESYDYKLKVRIYSNGCGSGKNTHLSVFTVVMKSEYDAILPWPFKRDVTYTLIDQQEDQVERRNVFEQLTVNKRPSVFSRRPLFREENPGWGYTTFISHGKLYSRRFVVDDTLFLQVEIGSPSS